MLSHRPSSWSRLVAWCHVLPVLAGFAFLGCQKEAPKPVISTPPKPAWTTLFSFHSAGGTQVLADTNAASLRRVLELPETAVLRSNLTMKLVSAVTTVFSTQLDTSAYAPLLTPLLDDLMTRETWLALRSRAGDPEPVWNGAVLLDGAKLALWQTNLSSVLGMSSNTVRVVTAGGVQAQEFRLGTKGFRFASVGNWLLWTAGAGEETGLGEWADAVTKSGRPCPVATDYWMKVDADFEALKVAPPLLWPTPISHGTLTVVGHKGRLTTSAHITFKEDPGLRIEPWTIPTNAVHDPLVSFTAGQGLDLWASTWQSPTNVAVPKFASQYYIWARSDVAFMTLFATPMPDATNVLRSVSPDLASFVNKEMDGKGAGGLMWSSNRTELSWRGLPAMIPYVQAFTDPSGEFLHGGFFPVSKAFTNPAPAELLGQVAGRTNLVYYDWEITEERLAHWSQMFQFLSLVSMKPKFDPTSAAQAWLKAVAPVLGNVITEVTRESAREFKMVRRSESGFTGIELNFLAQWFEETNFPFASLRMPFEPVGFALPPPRPSRGTNRVRAATPPSPGGPVSTPSALPAVPVPVPPAAK